MSPDMTPWPSATDCLRSPASSAAFAVRPSGRKVRGPPMGAFSPGATGGMRSGAIVKKAARPIPRRWGPTMKGPALMAYWIWPATSESGRGAFTRVGPTAQRMAGRTLGLEAYWRCVAGRSISIPTSLAGLPLRSYLSLRSCYFGFGWWSSPCLPPLYSGALFSGALRTGACRGYLAQQKWAAWPSEESGTFWSARETPTYT
jgi:hypothetical protein